MTPEMVATAGVSGTCGVCVEALRLFCAFLGGVAGNVALTCGARGGVYLAGGILPRFPDFLERSAFCARFAAKGRLRPYMEEMSIRLITHPLPAFVGLRSLLRNGLSS
ncbi:hypothetical protein CCP2SC5_240002 [Azospirillaceae bacterium]